MTDPLLKQQDMYYQYNTLPSAPVVNIPMAPQQQMFQTTDNRHENNCCEKCCNQCFIQKCCMDCIVDKCCYKCLYLAIIRCGWLPKCDKRIEICVCVNGYDRHEDPCCCNAVCFRW